jgi:predicted small lipoprotein YifL
MRAALVIAAGAVLAACGQKGPLYLPDATGEVVTRPAPAETPPPEKEEDDETTKPPE